METSTFVIPRGSEGCTEVQSPSSDSEDKSYSSEARRSTIMRATDVELVAEEVSLETPDQYTVV